MSTEQTPAGLAPALETPRSPYKRNKPTRTNWELYGWLFMRMSGVVLVVLIFGHLFVNLMTGNGIYQIDWGFVAGKWASHSISDYAERDRTRFWLKMALYLATVVVIVVRTRFWLKMALYLATVVVIVVGTLVIFTFDPCADPNSTLEICRAGSSNVPSITN